MIGFIKDNSYSVFKMIINQVAMAIFGLALTFATSSFDTIFLSASIFAAVFYMVLLYTMTWDVGREQSRSIETGKRRYVPLSGAYMSLLANALNIILAVMIIVGYCSATEFIMRDAAGEITQDASLAVSTAPSAPEWATNVYGIGKLVLTFLFGMYNGIIAALPTLNPWIYILLVLPSVVVCGVAYPLGVKGKSFTGLLGKKPSLE